MLSQQGTRSTQLGSSPLFDQINPPEPRKLLSGGWQSMESCSIRLGIIVFVQQIGHPASHRPFPRAQPLGSFCWRGVRGKWDLQWKQAAACYGQTGPNCRAVLWGFCTISRVILSCWEVAGRHVVFLCASRARARLQKTEKLLYKLLSSSPVPSFLDQKPALDRWISGEEKKNRKEKNKAARLRGHP